MTLGIDVEVEGTEEAEEVVGRADEVEALLEVLGVIELVIGTEELLEALGVKDGTEELLEALGVKEGTEDMVELDGEVELLVVFVGAGQLIAAVRFLGTGSAYDPVQILVSSPCLIQIYTSVSFIVACDPVSGSPSFYVTD